MRSVTYVGLLTLVWLLAWGNFSIWNIAAGAALASGLLVAFPLRRPTRIRMSPVGFLRLVLYLIPQLAISNILVAREIISPRSRVRTGVLAYPVERSSDELLALMSNVIALTPGTMTVEARHDPPVLYAHFLLLDDVDRARASIAKIEQVCRRALSGGYVPTADHKEEQA